MTHPPRHLRLPLRPRRGAARQVAVGATVLTALAGGLVATSVNSDAAESSTAPTTYSIWPATTTPKQPADPDTASVELGTQFRPSTTGWVSAIRFYKSSANTGTHTGTLWSSAGQALARVTFTGETTQGWQQALLSSPVKVSAGATYTASYRAPKGRYAADQYALSPTKPVVNRDITALKGVYSYASNKLPKNSWNNSNYYVDILFTPGTSAPTSSTTSSPATSSTSTQPSTTTSTSSTTTSPSSTTTATSTTSSSTTASSTTTSPAPSTTSSTTSSATTTSPTTSATAPAGACASSQVWQNLEACGWAGPSNTGYPAGQTFAKTVTGGLTVTADNTVIDGWKISGGVQVRAKNVTIRNSWIANNAGGSNGSGVVNLNPGSSATIERTTLDGQNATHTCIWHEGSSMTARANNCYGANDGIFMWATQTGVDGSGDNFVIEDNWLHGFTTQAANGHVDGIQTEGAKHGVIRHNTIDVAQAQTSAVALWNSRKNTDDVKVERNLMAGGGFTAYAEDYSPSESNPAGGYSLTNVTFTDNTFSTARYGCVGNWGVWFTRGAPTDGWKRSGNVVLETGQKIDAGNPTYNGSTCN